jgi:hypothetical protein
MDSLKPIRPTVRLASKHGFSRERLLVHPPFQKSLLLLAARGRCQLTPLKDANHAVRLLDVSAAGGKETRLYPLIGNQNDADLARVKEGKIFFKASTGYKEVTKC